MSALLDSVLDDARQLHAFTIRIGKKDAPRLEFSCMAVDSSTAFMQHMDLAEVGERCEVIAASRRPILQPELSALPDRFSPEVRK